MQVPYTPTWKEYEEGLHSDDPKKAMKSADAFDITRKKEMAISKKARDWEEARKSDIAKAKPAWVKKQQQAEQEESTKIISKIKDFGTFDLNLHPYRGFILIKIIKKESEKTSSGLYLPDAEQTDNVAEVIEAGGPIYLDRKTLLEAGVSPKDKVLIKKFAGIEVDTKQGKCKLIQFSDILGILE